jgi:hypothetical protein
MGAMSMKAVLGPEELRASFVFLKPRVVWTLLAIALSTGGQGMSGLAISPPAHSG